MDPFKVSFVILLLCIVLSARAQVSTKLDLDENSKEQTNPKSTSRSNTGSGSTNKISPKIEGVRVTVDTSDGKKTKEAESKESVEIVDNKGGTKRVGIHTDITFEITDDKIDTNTTSLERGEKDNDASVPIFKGRSSTRRPLSRLPYNPKIHINYPEQPDYNQRERDHYNGQGHSIPAYPGYSDEGIYRTVDRWSNVIPLTGVWTTERSSYYIPSRSHHTQHQDVNYRSFNQPISPHYHHSRDQQLHYAQNQQALGSGHEWQPCVCIYDSRKRGFRSVTESKVKPALRRSSHAVSSKIDK